MLVLEFAYFGKDYVRSIIPIATSARYSAWGISWGEAQRQSIYSDPKYDDGYYTFDDPPTTGLGAARMSALLTYRSRDSFETRFGRNIPDPSRRQNINGSIRPGTPGSEHFTIHNEGHRNVGSPRLGKSGDMSGSVESLPSPMEPTVTDPQFSGATPLPGPRPSNKKRITTYYSAQSYLRYQGDKFIRRFDANCYIAITRKLDTHDVSRGRTDTTDKPLAEQVRDALKLIQQPTLVLGIMSDGLFTFAEQQELAASIPNSELKTIDSPEGHDAFLLEFKQVNSFLLDFLKREVPHIMSREPVNWPPKQEEPKEVKASTFGEAEVEDITACWQTTTHLIAFGDSYTYIQGTFGRQNFSFIGDSQHLSSPASTLLTNQIVQNQTSTAEGGPNWIEILTGCGMEPGLTDPKTCAKQVWDFAFGGADISTEWLPLHHPYTTSFVNQTRQFAEYGDPALSSSDLVPDKEGALVAVWMGINDINDSADGELIPAGMSYREFYQKLQESLFEALESNVLAKGYRKFLFVTLPPLDRTPGNVERKEGEKLPNATMIEWFNDALRNQAEAFQARHGHKEEGVEVMIYDSTTFLNHVLDSPEEFGIKNTTDYCRAYDQPYVDTDPGRYGCQPLDEFFWFNTGHMTSHTHAILAEDMLKFLTEQGGGKKHQQGGQKDKDRKGWWWGRDWSGWSG
ncbi:Homoserine [Hortaea werneckii]|nr:Homoserine [Hortaea werneckii]